MQKNKLKCLLQKDYMLVTTSCNLHKRILESFAIILYENLKV